MLVVKIDVLIDTPTGTQNFAQKNKCFLDNNFTTF